MTTTLITKDTSALTITRDLTARIAGAKAIYRAIVEAEGLFKRTRDQIVMLAHRLGRELCNLKDEVGHGRWQLWLTSNFRELGATDEIILKNAQRVMAIYSRCPTAKTVSEIDAEAMRKFMWGYVTAKERQALTGDCKDSPAEHPLTFVNNFAKWDRQLTIGQATLPPLEILRHELEQPVRRIIELCGADWVRSLL